MDANPEDTEGQREREPAHALPEPIRATMQALANGILEVLGRRVLGVYLGGSASLGEFNPASSDVDFLVVTDGPLMQRDHAALAALHDRLRQETPLGSRLEGDYAPRELLTPSGTVAPVPEVRDGHFNPDVSWIMLSSDNLVNMQEHGISFHGPAPRTILPFVTPDDVRAAVREMLDEGPEPTETPAQAASEVLGLVRSLCSLETGRPTTKDAGAAWALERLDGQWHPIVRAALALRNGQGTATDNELVKRALPALYRALWPRQSDERSA
jgi:hypothetical protein